MIEEIVKLAKKELPKGAKILDLGCGDGEDVEELKKLGFICEGVDLKKGVDLNNPYQSSVAPFDMVMSNFVLHFLDNQEQLVKTAYSNLREGGVFYFQDLEKQEITNDKYRTLDEVAEILTGSGFKVQNSKKSNFFDEKEGHKHWHIIMEVVAKK